MVVLLRLSYYLLWDIEHALCPLSLGAVRCVLAEIHLEPIHSPCDGKHVTRC